MIFGQLIEYNMKTIFLEKSYARDVVGRPPGGVGGVQTFYSDFIYLPTFNSPICLTFISIIDYVSLKRKENDLFQCMYTKLSITLKSTIFQ